MATERLYNGSSSKSGSSTKSGSTSRSSNESWGSSDSHTTSGSTSHSEGGSTSHSEGGSTSHSVGGSSSQSVGGSQSRSQSVGGNTQVGSGKTWASGQVSDRTQQKFNEATQDYVRSQKVEDAYANLQSAINAKPAFQSKFEDQLNSMYDKIMNREAFTYDFNKDAMYQQYKDMYQQQGKRAMQDTMGQLSAMNNGYGSSYSQTAGQQTYQNYLQQLMDRIPELRQQALEEYDREGNRLNQQYQLTNDAYNREYGQYRDNMSDWQADRSFNQSAYQDERNFDYNQAQNDRNFWQNEYWQERNAEQSNMNQSQGTNWNEGYQEGKNWSNTESQNWQDTNSRNWSDTESRNWSDTDTTGWSNTHSDSYNRSQGRTDTTGWQDTNSWQNTSGWKDHFYQPTGSGSGSASAGNNVQFSDKNSMGGVFSGQQRQQVVNDVSALARQANMSGKTADQNKVASYLKDLYKNGSTGSNGEHVQYSVEDLTNIYNRAITMDVISNGSRNGAQTLSTEEMARKLGIRLN